MKRSIRHPIAFLTDLTVQQDGQYVKTSNTLDENLRALDAAIGTGSDVSNKADKVAGATSGNLAALDANGNLVDSGKNASEFATAEQGIAASTAVQPTDLDGTTIEKDATKGIQVKDGAITTEKLANLESFNMVDTSTGATYRVQITNGRMEIVMVPVEEEPEG